MNIKFHRIFTSIGITHARCAVVQVEAAPHRDKTSKWYISHEQWPLPTYPPICLSGAFLLTPALTRRLYEESHYYSRFPLEDVFFSGIAAQNISGFVMSVMPGDSPYWWPTCSTTKCLDRDRNMMFYHTAQNVPLLKLFAHHWQDEYEKTAMNATELIRIP